MGPAPVAPQRQIIRACTISAVSTSFLTGMFLIQAVQKISRNDLDFILAIGVIALLVVATTLCVWRIWKTVA